MFRLCNFVSDKQFGKRSEQISRGTYRRRAKPSVNQHYGICMLFTLQLPSTFVWIIPEINQRARVHCPLNAEPCYQPLSYGAAPRKADKWPQFVHFMLFYIIRRTWQCFRLVSRISTLFPPFACLSITFPQEIRLALFNT